jgi:hypothetical protein
MAKELVKERGWSIYVKKNNSFKWWNGYDGHEIVIVHDFRHTACKLSEFLEIVDKYEVRVENKGSMRQFKPRVMFLSCPYHPKDFWPPFYNGREDLEQFKRRINHIRHFPDKYICPEDSIDAEENKVTVIDEKDTIDPQEP